MDVGQSPIFTADVSYSSFPLLVTTELNYITCFMNTKKSIFLADCGQPPQIPRTTIKGLEGGTLEGAVIMYYCDENTDPSGNPSSVCTKKGIWSDVTIKCTRK